MPTAMRRSVSRNGNVLLSAPPNVAALVARPIAECTQGLRQHKRAIGAAKTTGTAAATRATELGCRLLAAGLSLTART
eukprot:654045-Pleurochrysis_carterae.AAC.1